MINISANNFTVSQSNDMITLLCTESQFSDCDTKILLTFCVAKYMLVI